MFGEGLDTTRGNVQALTRFKNTKLYLFKIKTENTRAMHEICFKLTTQTPDGRY